MPIILSCLTSFFEGDMMKDERKLNFYSISNAAIESGFSGGDRILAIERYLGKIVMSSIYY